MLLAPRRVGSAGTIEFSLVPKNCRPQSWYWNQTKSDSENGPPLWQRFNKYLYAAHAPWSWRHHEVREGSRKTTSGFGALTNGPIQNKRNMKITVEWKAQKTTFIALIQIVISQQDAEVAEVTLHFAKATIYVTKNIVPGYSTRLCIKTFIQQIEMST